MADKCSVQVALRIRPLVPSEIQKGCKNVLEVFPEEEQIKVKDTERAFTYNHVLDHNSTQEDLYNKCVKDMISSLFEGYNLTILAYGQTGSGKSHSMGTVYCGQEDMGIIPKSIHEVFEFVKDNFALDFIISVSFMELYQEVLYDLLSDKPRDQCTLEIREDYTKGIHVPGVTEVPVTNAQEVLRCLAKGSERRATGCTNMNSQSSRSHAIFTLNVFIQNKEDTSQNKTAKFHFVDLAGSERSKKTGAIGNTFKEGVNINKGLLALGNVISMLGEDKPNAHVPYRDSNLTRILKDSLGGNSITLMIACVSPADYNLDETMSTLRYADRARKIRNKPIVNQDPKMAEINELRKLVQQLKLQIVGQGGPSICPAEIELLKKSDLELRTKMRELMLQLSSALHEKTGALEKVIIIQEANDKLMQKNTLLKEELVQCVEALNLALNGNDMELVRLNVEKLALLQNHFEDINAEQKKTEDAIKEHEHSYVIQMQNGNVSGNDPESINEINERQETHTTNQVHLNNQLQEITKQLMQKEHLAMQIATNSEFMVDYEALASDSEKIKTLEMEKEQLLQQVKSQNHAKPNNLTNKRIKELEDQIKDLRQKLKEQNRMIQMKEKDQLKIKSLNTEILQMKQKKVQLIRTMKEDGEKFRAWKLERERLYSKLKQEDMKKQNQIVKLTNMHNKQQNVLKRKVEEAAAMNKRLKEALTLRKNAHEQKFGGKVEKVGQWIKQELDVFIKLTEADVTLGCLLEDRATLYQQLEELKNNNGDPAEIKALEEDIETRSYQISDIQQKLLDSDDEKNKNRLDKLQTMGEAKYAIKTIFDYLGDFIKTEKTASNKLDLEDTIQNLLREKKELEDKIYHMETEYQREYEEKVSVLLRQLRGVTIQNADETLTERCKIQEDKIALLEKKNRSLENTLKQILAESGKNIKKDPSSTDSLKENKIKCDIKVEPSELEQHFGNTTFVTDKVQDKESINVINQSIFLTPKNVVKKKKHVDINSTFILNEKEEEDCSDIDMDDLENDPDWRNTPLGKRILKERDTISFLKEPSKRSSEGGCTCSTSCHTKRCGCKKINNICGPSCKCDSKVCKNRESFDETHKKDSTDEDSFETALSDSFKKPRLTLKPQKRQDLFTKTK